MGGTRLILEHVRSFFRNKTERNLERCQTELISNFQPDHLLWTDIRRVERSPTFREVNDFDSDHSTNRPDQTRNGED